MRRSFKEILSDGIKLFIKDIKSAKWVIIFVIAYFAFLRNMIFSMCPMVMITGYPCPSCGMTRAGIRLLHLDFAGAWEMHPFIYGVVLLVILFAWNRYIRMRPMPKYLSWLAGIMLIALVVFYVYRVKKYFPGDPPMSYYEGNLVNRIREFLHHLI